MSTDDFLRQATTDIIKLLTVPLKDIGPVLEAGDKTRNGILKVARLLNRSESIPSTLPPFATSSAIPSRMSIVSPTRVLPSTRPLPRVSGGRSVATGTTSSAVSDYWVTTTFNTKYYSISTDGGPP